MKLYLYKTIVVLYATLGVIRHTFAIMSFGTISHCKHKPTCSTVFFQTLRDVGLWRAIQLSGKQLLSCR